MDATEKTLSVLDALDGARPARRRPDPAALHGDRQVDARRHAARAGGRDPRPLVHRTPQTLVSLDAIHSELEHVRERGFAIDDEENERKIRCVGSAVRHHTGAPMHAISASALTVDVPLDDAIALGPRVVAAAQAVSEALGAR
jgi:DNA-binding IclR family transcriptional regulator